MIDLAQRSKRKGLNDHAEVFCPVYTLPINNCVARITFSKYQ